MKKPLLYLEQGFDEKYPLAFLSRYNCVMLQTTKCSADGTPRYCPNPNAEATYCLQDYLKDPSYVPIRTKAELELALRLENAKNNAK